MGITESTRRQSYEKTIETISARQREVYDLLARTAGGLSAWQVAAKLDRPVYVVRPRLTELRDFGLLMVCGERYNEGTDRSEAIWRITLAHEFGDDGQGRFKF